MTRNNTPKQALYLGVIVITLLLVEKKEKKKRTQVYIIKRIIVLQYLSPNFWSTVGYTKYDHYRFLGYNEPIIVLEYF